MSIEDNAVEQKLNIEIPSIPELNPMGWAYWAKKTSEHRGWFRFTKVSQLIKKKFAAGRAAQDLQQFDDFMSRMLDRSPLLKLRTQLCVWADEKICSLALLGGDRQINYLKKFREELIDGNWYYADALRDVFDNFSSDVTSLDELNTFIENLNNKLRAVQLNMNHFHGCRERIMDEVRACEQNAQRKVEDSCTVIMKDYQLLYGYLIKFLCPFVYKMGITNEYLKSREMIIKEIAGRQIYCNSSMLGYATSSNIVIERDDASAWWYETMIGQILTSLVQQGDMERCLFNENSGQNLPSFSCGIPGNKFYVAPLLGIHYRVFFFSNNLATFQYWQKQAVSWSDEPLGGMDATELLWVNVMPIRNVHDIFYTCERKMLHLRYDSDRLKEVQCADASVLQSLVVINDCKDIPRAEINRLTKALNAIGMRVVLITTTQTYMNESNKKLWPNYIRLQYVRPSVSPLLKSQERMELFFVRSVYPSFEKIDGQYWPRQMFEFCLNGNGAEMTWIPSFFTWNIVEPLVRKCYTSEGQSTKDILNFINSPGAYLGIKSLEKLMRKWHVYRKDKRQPRSHKCSKSKSSATPLQKFQGAISQMYCLENKSLKWIQEWLQAQGVKVTEGTLRNQLSKWKLQRSMSLRQGQDDWLETLRPNIMDMYYRGNTIDDIFTYFKVEYGNLCFNKTDLKEKIKQWQLSNGGLC